MKDQLQVQCSWTNCYLFDQTENGCAVAGFDGSAAQQNNLKSLIAARRRQHLVSPTAVTCPNDIKPGDAVVGITLLPSSKS